MRSIVALGALFFLFYFSCLIAPTTAVYVECSFSTPKSLCTWSDPNNGSWIVTNRTSIDPGHDHTCGIDPDPSEPLKRPYCGWLSTIPNYNEEQEFVLISRRVPSSHYDRCFTFAYHFFGLEKADLAVMINTQNRTFNAVTLWERHTPQSNGWARGAVPIKANPQYFYIIFYAKLASKYHDVVGLDDIALSYDPCPRSPICDLEHDLCQWTHTAGMVIANATPIARDHSYGSGIGHYLINNGNVNSTISGALRDLTREYVDGDYSSFCLKFWYYIQTSENTKDTSSYIYAKTLYSVKKVLIQDMAAERMVNSWQLFFLPISYSARRYNRSIDINVYTTSGTNIAIDDLLIQDHACEPVGDCDFENDFCGWSNMNSMHWLRGQGGNRNSLKKSPRDDTTTHTASGWFAIIPSELLRQSSGDIFYHPTLESPPLSKSSVNCFGFNYFAIASDNETPVLRVLIFDLAKGTIFHKSMLNATVFEYWTPFRLPLSNLPLYYSISITAMLNRDTRYLRSDIAIDDISLRSKGCSDHHREKSTTTPIPPSERYWNCNFEYKCRGWQFDPNEWQQTSFHQVGSSVNAPRSDHTLKIPEGNYLLWMPSNATGNHSMTSVINSTMLTDKQHCLSFWYFDASEVIFELNILTLPSKWIRRRVATGIESRKWKFVEVDIIPYEKLNAKPSLQLSLSTSTNARGAFAIDDIRLIPMECKHGRDYLYTFDMLDSLEMAHITPLNRFIGGLHYYQMKTYPKAPRNDHTTGDGGYFIFMNRKSDFNTTYLLYLSVNNLPAMHASLYDRSESGCLKFAFQASGNASLTVYTTAANSYDYESFLFKNYADHTSWVTAQVPYHAYYEHNILFVFRKSFDIESYVAIDDLMVSRRPCRQPVECDFDDDTCSYSPIASKSNYAFFRYLGPPVDARWPGPAFDHTKRGYGGGYLAMTGYPSTKDMRRYATLQTPLHIPRYRPSGNYCLSLFTHLSEPDAELVVQMNVFGGADSRTSSSSVVLATFTNLTESGWTRHTAHIDNAFLRLYRELNIMLIASTSKANTVVAVDDVELSTEPCASLFFTCANDEKSFLMDKVCDFVNDCTDGSDEKNCGNCDFESGSCGWTNKDEDPRPPGWWGNIPASRADSNAPKTDGSGNAKGHYLLLEPYRSQGPPYVWRTLTRYYQSYRYQFKDAFHTCMLTFDYYLNSDLKYTLAELTVSVGSDEDSAVPKDFYLTKSDKWQRAQTYVEGFAGSFVVMFEGSNIVTNETLAIDNICFQNCSIPAGIPSGSSCPSSAPVLCKSTQICIDHSDMCDFENNCGDNWDEAYHRCAAGPKAVVNCAFEKSLEECAFHTETSEPTFNWTHTRGYSGLLHAYSAPASDHTTRDKSGRFLLLRAHNTKSIGRKVRLYTPFITTASSEDCHMRFFYFNNGNASVTPFNQLAVWAQYADGDTSSRLFTTDRYLSSWLKGKVRFRSSSTPFRFVFESSVTGLHNSISLDDVSFYGSCLKSDAKFSPVPHSAALTVVLVIFSLLAITGGGGYFVYRRHQAGRLSLPPFIQRFVRPKPSSGSTLAFSNQNHE